MKGCSFLPAVARFGRRSAPIRIYDARPRGWWATLSDLWTFREVIGLLVYQRLAIRYRRSVLGFLWAFLNPFIQITVLAIVFGMLFHRGETDLRTGIIKYFVYIASGLLPWQFFQLMVVNLSSVFVGAENMVKKIYLPFLVFPISQIIAGMIDLALGLLALLALFACLQIWPSVSWVAVIPGIFMLSLMTLGVTLFVAVLTVYFRDMGFIIGVVLQLWFYATPIVWRIVDLPERFEWIFKANPFWNYLLFFRESIQLGNFPLPDVWLKCLLWGVAAFVLGFSVYRGVERKMIFRL